MSWSGNEPELTADTAPKLLDEAIAHIVVRGGTADEMADCFEELVPQITARAGHWAAERHLGTDGAHIFHGDYGHALVIAPDGRVYRGAIIPSVASQQRGKGGIALVPGRTPEGTFTLNYECDYDTLEEMA